MNQVTLPARHRRPRWCGVAATFLAATVVAAVATACGPTDNDTRSATMGLPDLEQSLMAHEWLLDQADSSITTTADASVALVFAGDEVATGTAACNRYRTHVTLDGDDGVRFDPVATTRRTCDPPEVMDLERDYLDALTRVRTADVHDRDRLVLTGDGVRLAFSVFDLHEEIVGDWSVVNVARGDAIESVVPGTDPEIRFRDDRSVTVETGCNGLASTWRLAGSEITFAAPRSTMMACDEPAGVMDQETALGAALTSGASVELTPTTLTVLDVDGSTVLVATRR